MVSSKSHHLFLQQKAWAPLQLEKNWCVLQLESLTFSEACLCFSIEINGIKGHGVKMLEYNNLFPRLRQIPLLFKVTNLLYRMSKIKKIKPPLIHNFKLTKKKESIIPYEKRKKQQPPPKTEHWKAVILYPVPEDSVR